MGLAGRLRFLDVAGLCQPRAGVPQAPVRCTEELRSTCLGPFQRLPAQADTEPVAKNAVHLRRNGECRHG